jgi:hypothetical protein
VLAPAVQFSVHLLSISRYYDGRFISLQRNLLLFAAQFIHIGVTCLMTMEVGVGRGDRPWVIDTLIYVAVKLQRQGRFVLT